MFSLRKVATPLATLLIAALPAWFAMAQEAAPKAPAKEQPAKAEPAKAPAANEQAAPAPAAKKEPAKAPAAVAEPGKDQPAKEQSAAKEQPKTSPNDPMLRVNGTTITRLDMERAVRVMLAQNQVSQPLPAEQMKQAEEVALEQLTSAELLYQEAAKLEIKDLDKQINEKIAANRAKFPSDAEFERALKAVDMTMKDMQDFTRKDLLINNFIEKKYADKVVVTEADAKKFYDENKEKYFQKPEGARASHILIGVEPTASTDDKKKAKEKAEAILKKVKAGEDFAALAKADSTCPSSSQGGDLGYFGKGQMVPQFEQAAFALKPGQVSDVVETQFGYHIIKLTDKQAASTESFESVKPKIMEFLKREQTQKGIVELVEKLRNAARIEKMY